MSEQRYRSLVAVYALVENSKKEILLLRRANTGYRDGFFDMPAGHLEAGETLRQAIIRELREETGLDAFEQDAEFTNIIHRFSKDREYIDIFFRIVRWTGEAKRMEEEKCDLLSWFPMNDLPKNIVPHQRLVIEEQTKDSLYTEYDER